MVQACTPHERAEPSFAFGGLVTALALPWLAHAAAVLPSALGLRPLTPLPAAVSCVLACVFAAVLGARAARVRVLDLAAPAWLGVPAPDLAQPASDPSEPYSGVSHLGMLGAVALGMAALLALTLPLVAYDALAYRIPVIAQWLDAGRIAWVQSDDPVRNGYPLGQEAVSALVAAATGSLRFTGVVSCVYVAAGALALDWLARACGFGKRLAHAGAGSFLLVPMVLLNAPSGYVDAAFAGACVAMFCTAARFVLARAPSVWLGAALGMACAHVLSLKGTGIGFVGATAAVVGAGIGVRLLRERRRPALLALGSVALGALPGAFWVLRNVAHTGNPLWPVSVRVGSHTLWRGVASMEQIIDVAHNMPHELSALPAPARVLATFLQLHGPALDFDDRLAGLGYAWPLFALPALVGFTVHQLRDLRHRNARARYAPVALVILLAGLCFLLQPMAFWPRYTLWLWGAGALALAAEADWLRNAGRAAWLRILAPAFATVMVVEAGVALSHAQGALLAATRLASTPLSALHDARSAINAPTWVSDELWNRGIGREPDVCRGAWKPGTDNANLDGVLAQLSPRPHVHIVPDDDGRWERVSREYQRLGCRELLLLDGSPVLASARRDPGVSVEPVVGFDPLFVVKARLPGESAQPGTVQP